CKGGVLVCITEARFYAFAFISFLSNKSKADVTLWTFLGADENAVSTRHLRKEPAYFVGKIQIAFASRAVATGSV
ncbi:MAG: hypothetical protein K8963_08490, partial [Proteobacteria bacterium]|nr:hypothetical protein [Pseudomonadota bacterium]